MNKNGNRPHDRPDNSRALPQPLPPERVSLWRASRPARILHCDDEPILHEIITAIFTGAFKDYHLIHCFSGDATLCEIAHRTPDLLITDLCHPGPQLEEMLPLLLRTPTRFPILVTSAQIGSRKIRQFLLNYPDFRIVLLDKPFAAGGLTTAVLKCLKPDPQEACN